MPASATITLDTTGPSLAVSSGQDPGDLTLVTLALVTDADAAEMKVWGAVDTTDPLNDSYGTVEVDADWIALDLAPQVRLGPLGGTLHIRVRDDVWNESTEQITTDMSVELPSFDPGPPDRRRQQLSVLGVRG